MLRLQLPAERASVEAARLAVGDFLAPLRLPGRCIYRIELILEEVLMNIVRHGLREQAGHVIALTVRAEVDEIVMSFEDDGPAFDPLAADAPEPAKDIDDARVGGLGLVLLRSMARTLTYERKGERNRLTVGVARDGN